MIPSTHNPDLQDLESAMNTFGDMVLRLAYARLQNRADAEDVYQSVFLQLYKSAPDFADANHQKAWLLRVTTNTCTDLIRRRGRAPEVAWDSTDMPEPRTGASSAQVSRGHDQLDEALGRLSDEQRTLVHLHYFEGYSAQEIGRLLGENPVTVRTHLMRARKALKISLDAPKGDFKAKVAQCVSLPDYEAPRSPGPSL